MIPDWVFWLKNIIEIWNCFHGLIYKFRGYYFFSFCSSGFFSKAPRLQKIWSIFVNSTFKNLQFSSIYIYLSIDDIVIICCENDFLPINWQEKIAGLLLQIRTFSDHFKSCQYYCFISTNTFLEQNCIHSCRFDFVLHSFLFQYHIYSLQIKLEISFILRV